MHYKTIVNQWQTFLWGHFGTLKECWVNGAIPSALQNNRDGIHSAICACVDIEEICLFDG